MQGLCFLYKGDEEASIRLRDRLEAIAPEFDVRFWSDVRAFDPGFAVDLRRELAAADAIVHCVGPKGLGFYQGLNEIDATLEALAAVPTRRLLIVLLDGADKPAAFDRFDPLPNARVTLAYMSADMDPKEVLLAALPEARPVDSAPESQFVKDLIRKTLTGTNLRSLTVIVGPYAAAEISECANTPERTIASLLKGRNLPGGAPWLDVIGSVAVALNDDPEDAAEELRLALEPADNCPGAGLLGQYLQLFAANWARQHSSTRLIIVDCTPVARLDLALRAHKMPVSHVRLVHRPLLFEAPLFAERIGVLNGHATRTELQKPLEPLDPSDRVVLVKPFGCFGDGGAGCVLLSAEHWREAVMRPMPLPVGLELEISKSAILVLGAGALTPSLHILFHGLLKSALANKDQHRLRYLIHSRKSEVQDGLHRLERAFAEQGFEHNQRFEGWLKDVYSLGLKRFELLRLLARFDNQLGRRVA